ncbi:Protein of unknown function [Propionibacterium freudenreichii]|nr:Protein of unknown function [Propionibacterium freudenreichii]
MTATLIGNVLAVLIVAAAVVIASGVCRG